MGSPPLDLEAFRQARLVAVSVPCGLVALGVGSAAMLRSVFAGRDVEQEGAWRARLGVCHVFLYPFVSSLPLLSVRLRKTQYTRVACITSHVVRFLALLSAGMGWLPTAESMRIILHSKSELVLDCVLALQDLLPLPLMAALYVLRHVGWMAILVSLGYSPRHGIVRGILNWFVMMCMSGFLEWRVRVAHKRASSTLRPASALSHRLHLSPASLCASEFSSALPSPTKGSAESPAGGPSGRLADARPHADVPQPTEPGSMRTSSASPIQQPPSSNRAATTITEMIAEQTVLHSSSNAPDVTTTAEPAADTDTARPTVAQDLSTTPSSSQPSSPRPPYALLAIPDWVGPQRTPALGSVAPDVDALAPNASLAFRAAAAALSYRTQARYRGFNVTALVRRRVYVKLQDADLRDMPRDFRGSVQQRLEQSMPGLAVSSVAARSGCVMLSIELQALGADGDLTADALVKGVKQALTQLDASAAARGMSLGNKILVQIGQHLAMLERASSADPFHLSLSNSPGPAPADTSALALRSVAPVVHCVDSAQPITANIKLQLPRGCHLLEQWVPPGVPHGSDVDSTHVGGQAKLLVREARGDYLPVRAEVVCVEATDAMTTLHTVKVHVNLPPASALCPIGLSLELWYTPATAGMSTGPTELLAAHVPMLALPHVCQDAASELAQIVPQLAGVPVLPDMGGDMHTGLTTDSGRVDFSGSFADHIMHRPDSQPSGLPDSEIGSFSPDHSYAAMSDPAAWQARTEPVPRARDIMFDTAQDICSMWDDGPDHMPAVEHIPTLHAAASASSIALHGSSDDTAPQLDESSNMAELVEDMGVFFSVYGPAWMAKQRGAAGISVAVGSSSMNDVMAQSLVEFVVSRGMRATADLLAGMLQSAALTDKASNWWVRWAGAGQTLLTAAIASGTPDVLELVLRWGVELGGSAWEWDWDAEGDSGYTPMHMIAAQRHSAVAQAMLQAVRNALRGEHARAARRAWLQCEGGVGLTPAELCALGPAPGSIDAWWAMRDGAEETAPSADTASQRSNAVVQAARMESHTSAAGPSSAPAPPPTTPAHPTTPHTPWPVLSWLAHVRDMLATTSDPDYQTWTMKQSGSLINFVSLIITGIGCMCLYRCYASGRTGNEHVVHALQTVSYLFLAISTQGQRAMNYQLFKAAMLVSLALHGVSYWYVGTVLSETQAWATAARYHCDTIFFTCLVPALDPTPVSLLIIGKAVFAYCHVLALRKAWVHYAAARASLVYVTSVSATVAYRLRQVHLYKRTCEARRKVKEE